MDLTVLVPFKNGGNEAWLREALGSIPASIPRLVLRNDGELAEALNAGVEQAETEFVFRLDADDVIQRDCLQFLYSLAWDVDVCYPTLVLTLQDLTPFEVLKAAPYCPNRLLEKNYIPGTSLYRRQALLDVGGYREMEIAEDWDLLVRLQRAGKTFKAVPEAHYIYRQHNDARNKRPVSDHQQINAKLKEEIVGETPELQATWYYQANYATTYWRCLLPARYLPGQAVDYPRVREVGDGDLEFPEHRGAGIWQFPADGARAVVMSEAQEQGYRVLIESDDNYFDASPLGNPGWVKTIAEGKGKGPKFAHSLEAHKKIIPWVDGVIVTTAALGKRYSELNGKIYICPNQIDPADWPAPEKDDDVLRIGWFASPSHRADAQIIERALEWASKQDGVEVWVMGFKPSWKFRHQHIPWSNDMGVYRKLLGKLHIGLAPVKETPWSVCRSDLKLLEYGMANVAAICSDATPYRNYPGGALSAKSSKEFLHQVKRLVQNPNEMQQLASMNRYYVLWKRTIKRNIWRWEEAIHDE